MRVLVVFNHPYQGSFCNSILNSVMRGLDEGQHEMDVIHLDKEQFDPVMRSKDLQAFTIAKTDPERAYTMLDEQVLDYKRRVENADHIVFIFPIWWELMPALTKGFIDKLIFPGIAYNYKENGLGMYSLLNKLEGVTMITTMNTPSLAYRLLFGNAIQKALMMGTFWKIGIKKRKWINLTNVKFSSDKKRAKWLSDIEMRFMQLN
ncbi:NAD(P)H-dependent oxidoreductase [Vibrio sp. SCSIO 43137]|uniref:NAD(P)H-dependent oxidoreductase n=1 Tax=Vibrio sp. SCSIO 43137 TaxID=3021011 RepID=UPI0023076906|nr:NAD(P)H-dependent oxidoreductase [Vibrio sp. SCSIO 43137]WCE32180.1 NAD(P)H-dependent oxidoreductase [Vibrio sp. SCSIO 43137]